MQLVNQHTKQIQECNTGDSKNKLITKRHITFSRMTLNKTQYSTADAMKKNCFKSSHKSTKVNLSVFM